MAVSLNETGFRTVLRAHNLEELQYFIQRVIFSHGGTVKAQSDFDHFAEDVFASRNEQSYTAIVTELQQCGWIIWPFEEHEFCDAESNPDLESEAVSSAATADVTAQSSEGSELDDPSFQRVLATKSVQQIQYFIQRVIFAEGGTVKTQRDLELFSEECCVGEGATDFVSLLQELRLSNWVIWPFVESDGEAFLDALGATSTTSCSSDDRAPNTGSGKFGTLSEPLPDTLNHGLSPVEAQGVEPEGQTDQVLSACPAALEESIKLLSDEVRLDGKSLSSVAVDDLGAFGVYTRRWGVRNLIRSQTHALVLRHPSDAERGLLLMEDRDRSTLVLGAAEAARQLGLSSVSGRQRVSEPFYRRFAQDTDALARLRAQVEPVSTPRNSVRSVKAPSHSACSSACAAGPVDEEAGQCPICFDDLESSHAAMRCSGEAGVRHYFHSQCMTQWVERARHGEGATCPLCRGHVEFNAKRLEEFLDSGKSADLTADDRSFLQACAANIAAAGAVWGDAMSVENAKKAGGIVAATGWGFFLAYSETAQSSPTLQNTLLMEGLEREHHIAQGIGYALGMGLKFVKEAQKQKEQQQHRQHHQPQARSEQERMLERRSGQGLR